MQIFRITVPIDWLTLACYALFMSDFEVDILESNGVKRVYKGEPKESIAEAKKHLEWSLAIVKSFRAAIWYTLGDVIGKHRSLVKSYIRSAQEMTSSVISWALFVCYQPTLLRINSPSRRRGTIRS